MAVDPGGGGESGVDFPTGEGWTFPLGRGSLSHLEYQTPFLIQKTHVC